MSFFFLFDLMFFLFFFFLWRASDVIRRVGVGVGVGVRHIEMSSVRRVGVGVRHLEKSSVFLLFIYLFIFLL